MFGKRMSHLLALMVVPAACLTAAANAAPPWNIFSSNSVEADPQKAYDLTEENGPWMIMACSFSGETADQQARDLVHELRKKHRLPAYVYKKRFDFGKIEAKGVDRFNRPVKMKYQRGLDQAEETAVLVGNYRAIDEPEGQEVLQKIKSLQPASLKTEEGKKPTRSVAGWRSVQQTLMPDNSELKKLGPMSHAFLTTNPLLPKGYFAPKGISREVAQMNESVEHSLLDCPGRYTVRIAHFTGNATIDQREIREIAAGTKELKSQLAEAAMKAHLLTKAMRKAGLEAYEFHDARSSIVTVGSFESVGTPRPDGQFDLSPDVQRIIAKHGGQQDPTGAVKAQMMEVGKGQFIPFDVSPVPVETPRRSIAADYRRDVIGRK